MVEFVAVRTSPQAEGSGAESFALWPPLVADHDRPTTYKPAPGLAEAVDVAMLLGVPLLLTGEPGTGKTRAAFWLAHELGLGRPLKSDVKSGTTGVDLLYSFDEVARFRDASQNEIRPLIDYVRFNALGLGILRGGGDSAPLTDLFGNPPDEALLVRAFGKSAAGEAPRAGLLLPGGGLGEAVHSVVLIDELDKAPRDTPNDLLAEFETLQFAIPELGLKLTPGIKRPIVILTSNSERSLPEPFLRRCAYFDIPFPNPDQLAEIVSATLGGYRPDEQEEALEEGASAATVDERRASFAPDSPLVQEAVTAFLQIHDTPQLRKKPGTAELLAWFDILLNHVGLGPGMSLSTAVRTRPKEIERTLCALLKSAEDLDIGRRILRQAASG
ncbi:MoxR-like ATPase [Sphingobium sp. OAS761]|uniref:AAA family ATPase n=1 Tax=Sphingobium sp. OAS761 TaxID=2817901 RepID=UPI00209E4136|nr:MoxR family ATPase [Sphingobium sp. OAS761]MCP1469022.1 MoxR-like ATPase [Sphingobium sp. OAS761]